MIRFTRIRWRNFLSTGNQFTEIQLNKNPTTLIIGENGAGKSTILDAICFGLFGKAFRNINKPQLVNSINQKNCTVEVEFIIGKKEYRIVRGMKPGVFEIYQDGTILSQEAANRDYQKYLEDKILKLNYKSFTQIVILGSASFTPFMQLSLGNRREIIEDILDIQIFTVMNSILKNRMIDLKEELRTLDAIIEIGKQKVKLQTDYIKQLEEDQKKREADAQLAIIQSQANINKLQEEAEKLVKDLETLKESTKDEQTVSQRRTEMVTLLKSLTQRIDSARDQITFYEEHDNCPTCAQSLTGELKTTAIEKHSHKIEEINAALDSLNNKISEVETRIDEISAIKNSIADIQDSIVDTNSKIISEQTFIRKIQTEAERSIDSENSLASAKSTLKDLAKEVVSSAESKSKLKENSYYFEACSSLLKDTGIKTRIIKQYLPVINKLVNKYLTAMDFFVSFELDEAFNETIKSRHRDDFSYASFSEGEKQRIDLALLFTWRTIAKMKNSAATNLLLLDEIFDSSLDAMGTEFVMTLLNTIGDDINVFVISHKGDQLIDKFGHLIKFEKHQNFSRIV
ncbi:MAG: AAA family ATPase [Minisyncoccia bacterium]